MNPHIKPRFEITTTIAVILAIWHNEENLSPGNSWLCCRDKLCFTRQWMNVCLCLTAGWEGVQGQALLHFCGLELQPGSKCCRWLAWPAAHSQLSDHHHHWAEGTFPLHSPKSSGHQFLLAAAWPTEVLISISAEVEQCSLIMYKLWVHSFWADGKKISHLEQPFSLSSTHHSLTFSSLLMKEWGSSFFYFYFQLLCWEGVQGVWKAVFNIKMRGMRIVESVWLPQQEYLSALLGCVTVHRWFVPELRRHGRLVDIFGWGTARLFAHLVEIYRRFASFHLAVSRAGSTCGHAFSCGAACAICEFSNSHWIGALGGRQWV